MLACFTRTFLQVSVPVMGMLCAAGIALGVAQAPQLFIALVVALVYFGVRRRFTGSGWVFGTARIADHADLISAGYLGSPRGFLIGCVAPIPRRLAVRLLFKLPGRASESASRLFFDSFGKKPGWVRVHRSTHSMIVAPTGAGKGAGLIVPTLLTDPGNFVVLDPKGELFKLTASYRRQLGHEVVALDPWHLVSKTPATFNPLSRIDPRSRDAIDQLRSLAESLVVRTGDEKEPHWNDSAEAFISTICAFVSASATPPLRTLQSVVHILSQSDELAGALKVMAASPDPLMQRLAGQLAYYEGKEKGGVLTTSLRHLQFLSTPAVMDSTSSTSFDPRKLVLGRMTAFLVMPTQLLISHSGLLRMWVAGLLAEMTRAGQTEQHRCTFLLDEAAALGRMRCIDNAITQLRGYGLKLCLVYQAISQLKACFPDGQDQTVLANMSVQTFFGVKDYATAEYVSKCIGNSTVENWSENAGTSRSVSVDGEGRQSTSTSVNSGNNVGEVTRAVFNADEVIQLPERTAITFAPGCPPICTRLVRYYEREFKGAIRVFGWRQRFVLAARAATICALTVGFAALLGFMAEKRFSPRRETPPVPFPENFNQTRKQMQFSTGRR